MKAIRWIVFLVLPIPLAVLVSIPFGMIWWPLGHVVSGLATPFIMHYLAPREGVWDTNMYMLAVLILFVAGLVPDLLEGKLQTDSLLVIAGMVAGLAVVNVLRDKLLQRVTTGGQGTAGAC